MHAIESSVVKARIAQLSNHEDIEQLTNYCFPLVQADQWMCSGTNVGEELLLKIAEYFKCPTRSITLVGSAKFGFSPLSLRPFEPGKSDLDLAVVDAEIFDRYREFDREKYAQGAYPIRPDHHPGIPQFDHWQAFFEGLSIENKSHFCEITVSLYRSLEQLRHAQAEAMLSMRSLFRTAPRTSLIDREEESSLPRESPTLRLLSSEKDISESFPWNSTPFTASLVDLIDEFQGSRRAKLLRKLEIALMELPIGIRPHAFLIGGSFVDQAVEAPKDLDCVVYYSLDEQLRKSPPMVNASLRTAKNVLRYCGVDARLAPLDADPLILVRITSFMTALYMARREGGAARRNLLLVDLSATRQEEMSLRA